MTNTEPQGIKDLREAKADYLASLSKLREADAEKVKAEAAVEQAKAATEQAKAALKQAKAKAQEIENQFVSDTNAIHIAKAKAEAEVAIKNAEANLVKAEETLATNEAALAKALQNIAAQALQLTAEERQIVDAYKVAYDSLIIAQKSVRVAEADLYDSTYTKAGVKSVEGAKAGYEADKARAEESKAFFEKAIAAHQEMTETQIASYEEWVKKYDALQAEIDGFEYDKAEIVRDSALNAYENSAVLDSFYAALNAKHKAIKNAGKDFGIKFSGDKALDLPALNVNGTNVVTTFKNHVNDALTIPEGQWVNIDVKKDNDTLGIKLTGKDVAKGVVDTLNIIIDALKREQVVVDQLVKDTAGIAALVDSTKHVYDSIKTVLEAGIGEFDVIAKAEDDAEAAEEALEDAEEEFEADTTALFKAIRDFIAAENANYKYTESNLRKEDSLKVWNAFIDLMKAREKAFSDVEGIDSKLYYRFYKAGLNGTTIVPVEDSVKFSELKFDGVVKNAKGESTYGGYKDEGKVQEDTIAFGNPFNMIVTAAVNGTFYESTYNEPSTPFRSDEDYEWLKNNTHNLADLFFGVCRVNSAGILWVDGTGAYKPATVTEAEEAKAEAEEDITDAKKAFYEDIYCKFWGIEYDETFTDKLNDDNTGFNNPADDSLKIVYTEKTFTDPTVLPTFKGETGFFSAATGTTPASIDFDKVSCETTKALQVIIDQLGEDYLKPEGGFTLYAQYLATAQFANDAKNYKENTAALAELVEVVAAVEKAYNDAVAANEAGSGLADSLKVALIGKAKKDIKDADYVYSPTIGADAVYTSGKKIEKFIAADGSFDLAGEQKELAEKWIADYAKKYAELEKQKKDIASTIADNEELSDIYKEYVNDLAEIENVFTTDDDPDAIYNAILNKFNRVNARIQSWIENCENKIAKAEGSLAKLEAGYDPAQIAIENAQDALDTAKKALETAKIKLAAAEAAYKQVLANHGITE